MKGKNYWNHCWFPVSVAEMCNRSLNYCSTAAGQECGIICPSSLYSIWKQKWYAYVPYLILEHQTFKCAWLHQGGSHATNRENINASTIVMGLTFLVLHLFEQTLYNIVVTI